MRRISEQLQRLGGSRIILIEGEAGTGKQALARRIYALSAAGTGQTAIGQGDGNGNCHRSGAGNESIGQDGTECNSTGSYVTEDSAWLFESEHELPHESPDDRENRAVAQAASRAARGVLVLRGIDELGSHAQSRLLHFIRSFENGAAVPASSPLRIICTSRQPLRTQVLNGKFLPELYYRLSAVCFSLPPLRERKEDLPGLAQLFIDTFSRERGRALQGLGPGALAVLLRHRWPGNVRELESVIRAACFSTDAQWIRSLDLVILPLGNSQAASTEPPPPQDLSLDGVLRRHVRNVLRLCSGNKARAASRLGISRSTLYRMLESSAASSFGFDSSGTSSAGMPEPSPEPASEPAAEPGNAVTLRERQAEDITS